MSLSADLREQTRILLQNVDETLAAFSEQDLDEQLGGVGLWQHAYHLLHSLDQWFVNPFRYVEPPFQEPGMSTLDRSASKRLGRADLLAYAAAIRNKLESYVGTISDESLALFPDGCPFSRFTLVLAQSRHLMYHVGILHCWALQQTGRWPKWIGISPPVPGSSG